MTFSDKIKLIRNTYNMTQAEFAQNIGISRANLVNIEKGRVRPTPVLINYIAVAYNLNKDWLMDDTVPVVNKLPLQEESNVIDDILFYFEQLNPEYKTFIANQIKQLVEIQQKLRCNNIISK